MNAPLRTLTWRRCRPSSESQDVALAGLASEHHDTHNSVVPIHSQRVRIAKPCNRSGGCAKRSARCGDFTPSSRSIASGRKSSSSLGLVQQQQYICLFELEVSSLVFLVITLTCVHSCLGADLGVGWRRCRRSSVCLRPDSRTMTGVRLFQWCGGAFSSDLTVLALILCSVEVYVCVFGACHRSSNADGDHVQVVVAQRLPGAGELHVDIVGPVRQGGEPRVRGAGVHAVLL